MIGIFLQMGPLWECMQKNADYYTPQMDALQAGRESSAGEDGDGSPNDEAKPQTTAPSGQQGMPQSPASAAAATGPSLPFDFDKITAEDIEAYLEQLDKDESAGRK